MFWMQQSGCWVNKQPQPQLQTCPFSKFSMLHQSFCRTLFVRFRPFIKQDKTVRLMQLFFMVHSTNSFYSFVTRYLGEECIAVWFSTSSEFAPNVFTEFSKQLNRLFKPSGGSRISQMKGTGAITDYLAKFSPKNCTEIKKIGPRGGRPKFYRSAAERIIRTCNRGGRSSFIRFPEVAEYPFHLNRHETILAHGLKFL